MRTRSRLAVIFLAVTVLLTAFASLAAAVTGYVNAYHGEYNNIWFESVTMEPGDVYPFLIELEFSGTRTGPVTAGIYQTWTLQADGTFQGSNPTTVTAPASADSYDKKAWIWADGQIVVPGERPAGGPYTLTIAPHELTGSSPLVPLSIEVTVTSSSGSLYAFEGFGSPVVDDLLNSVKAGQTVPLRWRLLDPTGAPVTDLATASVAVRTISCGTLPVDPVEELASGQSGLQNLGDGYYQFNWKTAKTPGCREVTLDLPYQFGPAADVPALLFALR
jgi:hypothetical protein